jgi:hypothetical protein
VAQKPETVFRNGQVIPFLKKLKHTFYQSIQQMAISGTPDILLCVRGRFVALELKSKGGKPTALQNYVLDQITKADGISLVASPTNWSEVKELLTNLDEGNYDGIKDKTARLRN